MSEAAADRQRHFSGGDLGDGVRVRPGHAGGPVRLRLRLHLDGGRTGPLPGRPGRAAPGGPGHRARDALAEFGADVADVVRTRMYVTHRRDCDAVGRVHAEVFGEHPPVATMVIVSGLLHPDMRVEIEVEACCRTPTDDRHARVAPTARARPGPAGSLSRDRLRRGRRRRRPGPGSPPWPRPTGGPRRTPTPPWSAPPPPPAGWCPSSPSSTRSDDGDHGHTVDKRTDMALVTLTAPDGRRALPLFTSVAALAAWDPAARPVPVSAARAAQAAVAEGCHVAVVDLAGPTPRPSCARACCGRWRRRPRGTPSHTDPFVARSVSRAVADEPDVLVHRLEEGEPPGQWRPPGRPGPARRAARRSRSQALATRVGERLATDGELRARVDALTFAVEAVRR